MLTHFVLTPSYPSWPTRCTSPHHPPSYPTCAEHRTIAFCRRGLCPSQRQVGTRLGSRACQTTRGHRGRSFRRRQSSFRSAAEGGRCCRSAVSDAHWISPREFDQVLLRAARETVGWTTCTLHRDGGWQAQSAAGPPTHPWSAMPVGAPTQKKVFHLCQLMLLRP